PLYRPNIFRALKILAKIILWGALVTIILVGGAILLARWGGVRWTLIPQNVRHPDHYWIVFVSSVLWAPIIEELTYRGVVQARLRQCVGIWPAIFLSALTFWIYHWISFRTITSPHHFGAGLLMAYSYERSRSLVAPIILHALGNLILISGDLFYLTHRGFVERLLGYS
ncbi:CPBP family intramembrane metalloprotease, partial [Myxococcota bacterium]|nr:CPBP family intramembrane metalloprotease [Myxococcota bacterium]MBU1537777.1 CPBP family intramembrane metalloprotease [Myxococcota bacterium]